MRDFWIVEQNIYDLEDFGAVYPGDTKQKDGAIHVIERAPAYAAAFHARNGLLAALSALDKRSPAYAEALAGLAALKDAWGYDREWPEPG